MALIDEIRAQEDRHYTVGNLNHLQHLFEGYRCRVVGGPDAECPYSPGSAREGSWQLGRQWAEKDLG